MTKLIKALQALHDTCHCTYLCCCTFWHEKYQIRSNPLIISQDNIILKSIKGHNSVEKFRKIKGISHNMDHISMHKQNFIKIHSLFLKTEILTPIKGHNSVEKFWKILRASHNTAYTKFHQNPSICSQDIKWKQNSDINQGP